jgi:hypothetical protein
MLEFYSPNAASNPTVSLAVVVAVAVALLVAACAQTPVTPAVPPASAQPIAPNAEPPPPKVNLSGFPLPYRQGYADGCASARGTERKDAARFTSDGNYRTGWQDGVVLCKKK